MEDQRRNPMYGQNLTASTKGGSKERINTEAADHSSSQEHSMKFSGLCVPVLSITVAVLSLCECMAQHEASGSPSHLAADLSQSGYGYHDLAMMR